MQFLLSFLVQVLFKFFRLKIHMTSKADKSLMCQQKRGWNLCRQFQLTFVLICSKRTFDVFSSLHSSYCWVAFISHESLKERSRYHSCILVRMDFRVYFWFLLPSLFFLHSCIPCSYSCEVGFAFILFSVSMNLSLQLHLPFNSHSILIFFLPYPWMQCILLSLAASVCVSLAFACCLTHSFLVLLPLSSLLPLITPRKQRSDCMHEMKEVERREQDVCLDLSCLSVWESRILFRE